MIKSSHKSFAENLLFALNVFIVFFLFFGDSIVIPQWLQPVGRLHPLILHFPIVILIMVMVLEFFRFRAKFSTEKLYHDFTTYLWLLGSLFAAITAIMGLFLAKEPGYQGATLQWHKWFGVAIVLVSTLIYWCRNAKWYTATVARSGAVLVIFSLVIAGHFGADLTHGDNFVLGPVWNSEKPKVPIDKALVFRDVIQPIFESKCIACHSPDKIKGGLMLTDERSILKGGRDGKLFVPGQPQISLLLQRIHMPEGEKKHMPPAGKPQLSADELNLLYLWVKGNAGFKEKVIDLPANDSLRVIAATLLKPSEETSEVYDFAAADDKDIKKLNNNYRVIYPLAKESPALGVNIYNKNIYTPKALEELSGIKKQVVSLDLNKMPVKDAELKTIAKFENLRTLNLNFSDIDGSGLKDLASLKYLKTLSLAGTKLNAQAIRQVSAIKSLRELALWDTGLPANELAQLQKANKQIVFIKSFKDDGKPIKLNNPELKNTSFVFSNSLLLQLSHPIKGTEIRYTTDGTDPDSIKSLLFKPGTSITQNANIKAKAYKAGWLGSDVVQFNFYKSTYTPDSISFIAGADSKYSADGARSLIDKDLGGGNFGNGKWLASQKDMVVYMEFKNAITLHVVTLDMMRNIGSQIFLPYAVEVWGGDDSSHLKLLSTVQPKPPLKDDPFSLTGLNIKLPAAKQVSCIKLVAKNIKSVPAWHPAKGKPGWVFMDEVFVN